MKQIGPSIIRTVVPWIVGMLVGYLAGVGFDVSEGIATEVVTVVVSAVYYGAVRLAETRLSPLWGWALGLPKAPTYGAQAAPSDTSPTGAVATDDTPGIVEGTPVDVEPATYGSKHDATYHGGN